MKFQPYQAISKYLNNKNLSIFIDLLPLVPAVLIYYLSYSNPFFSSLSSSFKLILPIVTIITTLWSGSDYLLSGYKQIKDILNILKNNVFNLKLNTSELSNKLIKLDMDVLISLSCGTTAIYLITLGPMAPLIVYTAPLFTMGAINVSRLFKQYINNKINNNINIKLEFLKKDLLAIDKLDIKKNYIYKLKTNSKTKTKNRFIIIPVDCELLSDKLYVKEGTNLSGEKDKVFLYKKGQKLFAGSRVWIPEDSNDEEYYQEILIKSLCDGHDSHYYKQSKQQIKSSEQASSSKSTKFRQTIDIVTSYFIISVIAISVLSFITWSMISGVAVGFQVMMDVFFAACPCALGISAYLPLSILKKLLLNQNISVYKDSIIDSLSDFNTVVFDKTGTLTKRSLSELIFNDSHDDSKLGSIDELTKELMLYAVYKAEQIKLNKNPKNSIASPIVDYFNNIYEFKYKKYLEQILKGFSEKQIDFSNHNGLIINIENKHLKEKIYIGNKSFLLKNNISQDSIDSINSINKSDVDDGTVLYIATQGRALFKLTFEQELLPEAQSVIDQLKEKNIDIHILTGDSKEAAEAIASKLGIDKAKVKAECTPDNGFKLSYIKDLQKDKSKKVLYVGDGRNDIDAANEANAGSVAKDYGCDTDGFFNATINYLSDIFILKQAFDKAASLQDNVYMFSLILNFTGIFLATVAFPISGMIGMTHCLGMCMALSSSIATLWCGGLIFDINKIINNIYNQFGIKNNANNYQFGNADLYKSKDEYANIKLVSTSGISNFPTVKNINHLSSCANSNKEKSTDEYQQYDINLSVKLANCCCKSKKQKEDLDGLVLNLGVLSFEYVSSVDKIKSEVIDKKYNVNFKIHGVNSKFFKLDIFEEKIKSIFKDFDLEFTGHIFSSEQSDFDTKFIHRSVM